MVNGSCVGKNLIAVCIAQVNIKHMAVLGCEVFQFRARIDGRGDETMR